MELIRQGSDESLLVAVMAARRALVVLTVEWSGPERQARRAFRAAAEKIDAEYRDLGVEFFSIIEDEDSCQAWLASLAVPQLGTGYPCGAGSVLWLEQGKVVSSVVAGSTLDDDITKRSLSLWNATA
jgi:hypothetical protein